MRRTVLVVAGVGCGGGTATAPDFVLTLDPVVAEGQAPLDDADVRLLVGDVLHEVETVDGFWQVPGVEALDADSVGILGLAPGSPDPWAPGAQRAWGRSGPLTTTPDTPLDVAVLVGAVGTLGTFGALPTAFDGRAAAWLPSGDVIVAGGMADPRADPANLEGLDTPGATAILRLDPADPDAGFTGLATLPEGRAAAAAAHVVTPDGPRVLVAGGRAQPRRITTSSDQAWLVDPATGRVVETGRMASGPRSEHVLLRRPDGQVWAIGGFEAEGDDRFGTPVADRLSFDVYDPGTGRWEAGGAASGVGSLGFGWADLGEDGVLVCGGGRGDRQTSPTAVLPLAGCARLTDDGPVATASLPAPRIWLAMAPFEDGVVALGGSAAFLDRDSRTGRAETTVWHYDPGADRWRPLGELASPRAMHAAVPLTDGSVLALGGTTEAVLLPPLAAPPLAGCGERLGPGATDFVLLDPCPAPAAGRSPTLAVQPGRGVFVLASWPAPAPAAWGLVPQPPPRPPAR